MAQAIEWAEFKVSAEKTAFNMDVKGLSAGTV